MGSTEVRWLIARLICPVRILRYTEMEAPLLDTLCRMLYNMIKFLGISKLHQQMEASFLGVLSIYTFECSLILLHIYYVWYFFVIIYLHKYFDFFFFFFSFSRILSSYQSALVLISWSSQLTSITIFKVLWSIMLLSLFRLRLFSCSLHQIMTYYTHLNLYFSFSDSSLCS